MQFSAISKFGLLELSRQRLRPALSEGSHITCPRCNGTGHIRDTESSALQILRMVQEESMKDNTAAVHVQVPVEVTRFLLNEKRTEITKIELKQRVTVLLVPNKNLETPNYRLERLRHDDPRLENLQASYTMIDDVDEEVGITRREKGKAKQEPVIKGVLPETPAPIAPAKPVPAPAEPVAAAPPPSAPTPAAPPAGGGFFAWVKRLFSPEPTAPAASERSAAPAATGAARTAPAGEKAEGRGGRGGRGGRDGKRGGRDDASDGRRGRGDRGDRGDRPRAEEGTRAASVEGQRPDERKRGEGRDNREARGDGRGRQGRGERDARRSSTPNGSASAAAGGGAPSADTSTEEVTSALAFVDTVPGIPEGGAPEGQASEGTGRRRRRGGRGGRDRDEARDGRDGREGNPNGHAVDGDDAGQAATSMSQAESSAAPTSAEPGSAAFEPAEAGERPEGRRRGRGRDRNRRDRDDGAPQDVAFESHARASDDPAPERLTPDAPVMPADSGAPTIDAPVGEAASEGIATASMDVEPHLVPGVAADASPTVAAGAAAEQVDAAIAARHSAAPAPAPLAAVTPFVLPVNDLQAVVEAGGLQWVGSDAEKVRAVQAAMAAEPPPVRVPRERKPVVVVDDGPLVLVETRKDLSQIKLPFETAGPQH